MEETKNNRRLFFAFTGVAALAASAVIVGSFIGNRNNKLLGEETSYSIGLTASKNLLANTGSAEESGTVLTALSNSVGVRFKGLSSSSGNWASIASGGYIYNVSSISRMSSLTLTGLSGSVDVYWSDTTVFVNTNRATLTGSTLSTTFSSYNPRNFKILATEDSTIAFVSIAYTCVDDGLVRFGFYPQTRVTDATTLSLLDDTYNVTDDLPTAADAKNWIDYGYYSGTGTKGTETQGSYMWYRDVYMMNVEYRAVYFTGYRPTYIYDSNTSTSNSNIPSSTSGSLKTGQVYYYLYEPLQWRVLSSDGDKRLLMSNKAIDAQPFYNGTSSRTIGGVSYYCNNYEQSTIRSWLNSTFLGAAIPSEYLNSVLTTTVDNSASSTVSSSTWSYCSNDTSDRLFLLSYADVTNTQYGFNTSANASDTARKIEATSYAMCQNTATSYGGSLTYWMLRSPTYRGGYSISYVFTSGEIFYCTNDTTDTGTVPAMWISL